VSEDGSPRRLAAILVGDVVGYSRHMARDEAATIRALTIRREEVDRLAQRHGGRMADFTGDCFLAHFPSAVEAVQCALEIQRTVAAANAALPAEERMELRIGAHLGDVRIEGDRLYGNGPNIAARLQTLAAPGGICLSGTVVEQVEGRLEARFRPLGERTLKNIPRPVAAFAAEPVAAAPGLPPAPRSLLIAPFASLSPQPQDAYLARGLAEDIATLLVGNPDFAILPRVDVEGPEGEAIDALGLARRAGAQYALSGSVRHLGERIRVAVTLVEVETQAQVWGDHYDRPYADLFDLQDEIVDAIATALQTQVWHAEVRRARRARPENLDAWSLVQRAIGGAVVGGVGREALREAESLLRRALEIQPGYPLAEATLALVLGNQVALLFSADPARDTREALALAESAAEHAEADPRVAFRVGGTYWRLGRADRALPFLRRSVRRDPTWLAAQADLGQALIRTGEMVKGLETLRGLVRKGRSDPQLYIYEFYLGYALLLSGDVEGAEAALRRSLDAWDRLHLSWATLGLILGLRGRRDEARVAFARARELEPDIPAARYEEALRRGIAEPLAEPLVALLRQLS
jgi:adenylate cyclase